MLAPEDPPPYQIVNQEGSAPVLLVCDHADYRMPKSVNGLGLKYALERQHIAWDIGAAAVTHRLSEMIDAPAAFTTYSRLVIDPNRPLTHPAAFPHVSDGIVVPGNENLSDKERRARADALYWPYHRAIQRELAAFADRGVQPWVLSIHTCTPVFMGFSRPWHIGVIWNEDDRLPRPLIEHLRRDESILVGDNKPYSGRSKNSFTLNYHAEPAGLPHAGIEIRQDLLADAEGVEAYARRLADAMLAIVYDDGRPAPAFRDAGHDGEQPAGA